MSKDAQAKASATQGQELSYAALTVESLSAERPDLVQDISVKAKNEGMKAGVDGERARITEIINAKGSLESTMKAVQDGTEASAFYKVVLEEERSGKTKALTAISESLGDGVKPAGKESAASGGADFMALVQQYKKDNACTMEVAMRAVAKKNPEARAAFVAAGNK